MMVVVVVVVVVVGGGVGGDGKCRTTQTFEFNNCGNKGLTKHVGLNFCWSYHKPNMYC